MIVDVHTHPPLYKDPLTGEPDQYNHVWRPDRPVKVTTCWDDYLEAQEPAEKSIVFSIATNPGGEQPRLPGLEVPEQEPWYQGNLNDGIAAFVAAHPGRLIGFMTLHPYDPQALEELERCHSDLGLAGVKQGANYQNFDPFDPRALAIYAEAERRGLPLMLHQGTSPIRDAPIRYAHPLLIDELATRYPELKIILAHLGHPWQTETCVVVRKHPNVYTDLSGNFYRPFSFWEQMIKATEWNVLDKILFGSDYPIATARETADHVRRVNDIVEGTKLPRVPEDRLEEIIHRDSLGILGIG